MNKGSSSKLSPSSTPTHRLTSGKIPSLSGSPVSSSGKWEPNKLFSYRCYLTWQSIKMESLGRRLGPHPCGLPLVLMGNWQEHERTLDTVWKKTSTVFPDLIILHPTTEKFSPQQRGSSKSFPWTEQNCRAQAKGEWSLTVKEGGEVGWGQAQVWKGRSVG